MALGRQPSSGVASAEKSHCTRGDIPSRGVLHPVTDHSRAPAPAPT